MDGEQPAPLSDSRFSKISAHLLQKPTHDQTPSSSRRKDTRCPLRRLTYFLNLSADLFY